MRETPHFITWAIPLQSYTGKKRFPKNNMSSQHFVQWKRYGNIGNEYFSFQNILLYTLYNFMIHPLAHTDTYTLSWIIINKKKNVKYTYFRNSNIVHLTPFKKKWCMYISRTKCFCFYQKVIFIKSLTYPLRSFIYNRYYIIHGYILYSKRWYTAIIYCICRYNIMFWRSLLCKCCIYFFLIIRV